MNLLYIQKSTGRGGAKNSLLETLAVIQSDGEMHPRVIVGGTGPFTARCAEMGVPVSVEKLPEWRKFFERLRFSQEIRRIAQKHATSGIDWVISNEMWWAPHAAQLARLLGCRSAVVLRDGIATVKKSLQYRLNENDLILPVSSTIAHALDAHPALADCVHVLFNSVSVPPAKPEDAAALGRLLQPFPNVRRWLLVVGKVCSRKNQADAVRLTRAMIDSGHNDLGLLLAGDIDPDYLPIMEAAVKQSGLNERVAIIGNFEGLAVLLDRAHTVLLPSFREGLPRSLVEAIISGKPAFSYPCEGVEDIYGVQRNRFVSASSDVDALTQVLRDAWADPAALDAAFTEVRRGVMERFSSQAHLARLRELLNASIQTPSR